MKVKFLICLICGWGSFLFSQERLGISNSNYSPTNSMHLNPSSTVDSRTYMQINIVGFNAYVKTNMGYIPDFSVRNYANVAAPIQKDTKRKQFLHAGGSVEALSFTISKRDYGAGFFIRGRSVIDLRRVPFELSTMMLRGSFFSSSSDMDIVGQNFRNAKYSTMTWVEYGVNFGKMIKRSRSTLMILGGNLKYNTGINMAYANMIRFKSHDDGGTDMGVDDLKAVYKQTDFLWKSGKGFGLDIGFTYKKMLDYVESYYANSTRSNCKYVDYRYKIGVALRDAGYVRFTKGNPTVTKVDGSGYLNPNSGDTSFASALQINFNSTTETGKAIWSSLPTAFTGQFDYNYDNYLYLNVSVIKNLVPNRITGVQSQDLISFCPRYEFMKFEAALPITFQRFVYPQIGLAIRYRSFVIGFDNLIPVLVKANTNGFGVYCSLAMSLFRNPACDTPDKRIDDCQKYKSGKNKIKRKKRRR